VKNSLLLQGNFLSLWLGCFRECAFRADGPKLAECASRGCTSRKTVKKMKKGKREAPLELVVIWNGERIQMTMLSTDRIDDLHDFLEMETSVRRENQKLFGLKLNGVPVQKLPSDTPMGSLQIAKVVKMMGSPDAIIDEMEAHAAAAAATRGELVDDLDWDYRFEDAATHLLRAEARMSLKAVIQGTNIQLMNPPRKMKKLLVLDLDHTLLDFGFRKYSDSIEDLKRPHLDAFLSSVHKKYDLVAWSQTRWHYVELKLTELGLITHPDYYFAFALDRSSMFKVTREHKGKEKTHEVKALELIWSKFPHWNQTNTIHVDDLARNFAMNPRNGLQCTNFKRKRRNASKDSELVQLAAYLELISDHPDFTKVDHSKWRERLQEEVKRR